jgi:excisionase family DNA binding protein
MRWMKAPQAAEYLGGISVKTIYAAVRAGRLKAARIGAGRNVLFCAEWLDAYAMSTAGELLEDNEQFASVGQM